MKLFKILVVFLVIVLSFKLYAGIVLQPCDEKNIKGEFNLIIYSDSFINDPETFIVFDIADDKISVFPYASSFKFRVIENLNEKEALKTSQEILKNSSVSFIKCSVIRDKNSVFGYELKPIYFPWIFGILEPVKTVYKKQNDTITIFIRLNPQVEKQIYNGDNIYCILN